VKTIDKTYYAETEVKRSKFLACLVPAVRFESLRKELRLNHPKANHIVWAYRKINSYDRVVEESSDDGEPKGCAGKPVLHVMQGNALVECGILIVRYFGGIKLGTGGMVRAYGEAARTVVECAELLPYEKEMTLSFFTDYSSLRKWEYLIGGLDMLHIDRTFDEHGGHWSLRGRESVILDVQRTLKDARIDFSVEYH
jgi:uncharacterized YigZ family protein